MPELPAPKKFGTRRSVSLQLNWRAPRRRRPNFSRNHSRTANSRSTVILAMGPPVIKPFDCRRIVTQQYARFPHRLAAARRLTVLGFVLICSTLPAAPLERSISPSRQFIIFGGNRILRSAVSDAAERVKSKLLALLQSRD